jgi:hypothetical protein
VELWFVAVRTELAPQLLHSFSGELIRSNASVGAPASMEDCSVIAPTEVAANGRKRLVR